MAFSIGGAADIFGLGAPRGPMGEEFPPLPLPQAPAGKDPAQAAYEDAIKEYLSQKREGFKSDPFDRLLEFGLATMASASRPGASALGAVGEGGLAALQGGRVARQDFQRDQAINTQDQVQRLGMLGQLASASRPEVKVVGDSLVAIDRNTGQAREVYAGNANKTEIQRYIAARDALPQGHPNRAILDAAINRALTSEGFRFTPEGMVPIQGGPADPRYVERRAFAQESGQAPFRALSVEPGGSVVTPFAGQGQGAVARPSPAAAPIAGATTGTDTTGQVAAPASPPRDPRVIYQDPRPAPGTPEGAFSREIGSGLAKDLIDGRDKASAAANSLTTISQVKGLLDGGVIVGTGAPFRLGLTRALATSGLIDGERVANTEAFVSQMGRITLDLVKNLGAGSGISNADLAFAERVAGGNIDMSERGIRKIVNLAEKAAQLTVERHNSRVDRVANTPDVPENQRAGLRVTLPTTQPQTQQPGQQPRIDPAAIDAELRRRGLR